MAAQEAVELDAISVGNVGPTASPAAGKVSGIYKFVQTLTPGSVGATTQAEQTFTVTGVQAGDVVIAMNMAGPPGASGVWATNVRVSAANTIAITYENTTAGALTPTSQAYTFVIMRV